MKRSKGRSFFEPLYLMTHTAIGAEHYPNLAGITLTRGTLKGGHSAPLAHPVMEDRATRTRISPLKSVASLPRLC